MYWCLWWPRHTRTIRSRDIVPHQARVRFNVRTIKMIVLIGGRGGLYDALRIERAENLKRDGHRNDGIVSRLSCAKVTVVVATGNIITMMVLAAVV